MSGLVWFDLVYPRQLQFRVLDVADWAENEHETFLFHTLPINHRNLLFILILALLANLILFKKVIKN